MSRFFYVQKRGIILKKKKKHFELSTLIVWIVLWIVNTYSDVHKVNIFINNRYYKMSEFVHDDDNDDAKVLVIPWGFLKTAELIKNVFTEGTKQ